MSLITPDIGLLFWMVVIFGAVFFILAKWGFPVITRMVEKRSDYIRDSLAAAEKARSRRYWTGHVPSRERYSPRPPALARKY